MYDLRKDKTINLDEAKCLKEETTYKFEDLITGKHLIAKLISNYDDSEDIYLISEFKKLALLSGEPEIATVYYIATANISGKSQSCYIMDFVEGKTLQEFLDEREQLIYEVIIDIILQLALALEKAHHFEIYHNDLHNGNVIIGSSGYLKLIDFLWWNNNKSRQLDQTTDIKDFKRICQELFTKCKDSDKRRFKIIFEYCISITAFKGLKKEIDLLDEMSFDMSLLEDQTILILSKLFELMIDEYTLNIVLHEKGEVPDKLMSSLTEKEQGYSIKNGKNQLQYVDSRIERIHSNLNKALELKLHTLKQINLIEWEGWIKNNGEDFIGPYEFNYQIWFTSKFLKWKKINERLPIFTITEIELNDLIITI